MGFPHFILQQKINNLLTVESLAAPHWKAFYKLFPVMHFINPFLGTDLF